MSDTVILQSHRFQVLRGWIGRCVDSVRRWADANGYEHRFEGDEIFARLPDAYRDKLTGRLPIQADLARLLWIQSVLEEGYRRVLWLDADTLIFAPELLSLDGYGDECAFGRELWVDTDKAGRLKLWKNVHNAACLFPKNDPTLPFLIRTTERIILQADPDHIAPQMVGPKLLTALDGIAGFQKLDQIGAFSPLVLRDIAAGKGSALRRLKSAIKGNSLPPLTAANLCASLVEDETEINSVIDQLLERAALP